MGEVLLQKIAYELSLCSWHLPKHYEKLVPWFGLCPRVYLDDILIIQREGESEEDHLNKIDVVLTRLKKMDFRANLRKSFFMQQEIEYLGYSLTTEGVKPQKEKVEAMKKNQKTYNS